MTLLPRLDQKTTQPERPCPWELGKVVFGAHGSGRGDLSENRKTLLKAKLDSRLNSEMVMSCLMRNAHEIKK